MQAPPENQSVMGKIFAELKDIRVSFHVGEILVTTRKSQSRRAAAAAGWTAARSGCIVGCDTLISSGGCGGAKEYGDTRLRRQTPRQQHEILTVWNGDGATQ